MELAGKYNRKIQEGLNQSPNIPVLTMQEGINQSLNVLSNPKSTEAQQTKAMIDLAYHQDTINKLNEYNSQHYPSAKPIPSLPVEVLNRLPSINNTDW
jgi:hypothetical protein